MAITPKKEKILIIEGDTTVGQQIVEALRNDGYTVILCVNGTEGKKSMYENIPHLILLDVTLPDIDGYKILEEKQAEPLLAKIPVFLMSSQGVPINMKSVPENSVSEFLMAMHDSPVELVSKVNDYFKYTIGSVNGTDVPSAKKKILWVEDDKLIGTILAKKIISSGFELFHAKNGEEALQILAQEKPDAVVVDLLLPGMSGFDILQKIQMQENGKNLPSMVLSNLSKPSDIEKAKQLGAKKFLVKAATSLDQIVAEMKDLCK